MNPNMMYGQMGMYGPQYMPQQGMPMGQVSIFFLLVCSCALNHSVVGMPNLFKRPSFFSAAMVAVNLKYI